MNPQDPPIPPPSAQPKRFFDVLPPGQAAPSTTSRPIIADNDTLQADPMMTTHPTPTVSTALESADAEETLDDNESNQQPDESQQIKVSVGSSSLSEAGIQNAPDQVDEITTNPESSIDAMQSTEPAAIDLPEDQPLAADAEPPQPSNPQSPQPEPNAPDMADNDNHDSLNLSSDNQSSALTLLELPAHADGGMVVVHHRGRQSKIINFALIVVAIILVVVVVDLLFDAGVIKTSLWHTHFLGTN